MEYKDKEVYYQHYCSSCKNRDTNDFEDPCNECLNMPFNEYSHKPVFYEHAKHSNTIETSIHRSPLFFKDYLYKIMYDDYDYDIASKYFMEKSDFEIPSGCSVLRNGRYVGRQLDWYYNNEAEFVTFVPRNKKHFASMGICGGLKELTNDIVLTGKKNAMYDILPFHMYDGVNEYGVFANINVVPNDLGNNIAKPLGRNKRKLSALMLIRFVLDNFRSAESAVTYLESFCEIYFPKALHNMGFESHFMIADPLKTFILEFVNDRLMVYEVSDHPYMTNFHISGVKFNRDGTVMTPETGNAEQTNYITKYGSGLERYNQIVNGYSSCNTLAGMRNMCNSLMYSKTYLTAPEVSEPFWYTEYVGGANRVSSPVEQLRATAEEYSQFYTNRVRGDNKTWHSTHSVVYDIESLTMNLVTQEDGQELTFSMHSLID